MRFGDGLGGAVEPAGLFRLFSLESPRFRVQGQKTPKNRKPETRISGA